VLPRTRHQWETDSPNRSWNSSQREPVQKNLAVIEGVGSRVILKKVTFFNIQIHYCNFAQIVFVGYKMSFLKLNPSINLNIYSCDHRFAQLQVIQTKVQFKHLIDGKQHSLLFILLLSSGIPRK